jgi:hypothetical protein
VPGIIAFGNAAVPPERNKRRKAWCRFNLVWIFGGVNRLCAHQLQTLYNIGAADAMAQGCKESSFVGKESRFFTKDFFNTPNSCAAFKSGHYHFSKADKIRPELRAPITPAILIRYSRSMAVLWQTALANGMKFHRSTKTLETQNKDGKQQ